MKYIQLRSPPEMADACLFDSSYGEILLFPEKSECLVSSWRNGRTDRQDICDLCVHHTGEIRLNLLIQKATCVVSSPINYPQSTSASVM